VLAYRLEPAGQKYAPKIRLPMLDGLGRRGVVRLHPDGITLHDAGTAPAIERMGTGGLIMDGSWLAAVGFPIPALHAETCAIFKVTRELV